VEADETAAHVCRRGGASTAALPPEPLVRLCPCRRLLRGDGRSGDEVAHEGDRLTRARGHR
jgi:hypothetical protein